MALQYYFTGTAAPTTTPPFNGATFVDTSANIIYWAKGISSSTDWIALPTKLSDLTVDADLAMAGLYKIKKALGMDFQSSSELTIATGAVTQTQSYHTIDTQADAATDDLDTITIASDMSMLLITLENAARIVTLKHGTGNINLPGDADVVMAENTVYFLLYNGSAWNLVFATLFGAVIGAVIGYLVKNREYGRLVGGTIGGGIGLLFQLWFAGNLYWLGGLWWLWVLLIVLGAIIGGAIAKKLEYKDYKGY